MGLLGPIKIGAMDCSLSSLVLNRALKGQEMEQMEGLVWSLHCIQHLGGWMPLMLVN